VIFFVSLQEEPPSAGDQQAEAALELTASSSLQEGPPPAGEPEAEPLADELMSAASSSKHIRSLIMKLSPPPKSTTSRVRKRKAESAALITGSPFKKMLEEKERKKTSSVKTRDGHQQPDVRNKKSNRNGERKAKVTKKKNDGQLQSKKSKKQCRKKIPESDVDSATSTSAVTCVCGIKENSTEDRQLNVDWIRCKNCSKWLHKTCAEVNGVFDDEYFYCDACVD